MPTNPQSTRRVAVPVDRLAGWIERFAARHGGLGGSLLGQSVRIEAADGAVATIEVPFPTLPDHPPDPIAALIIHAARDRRVGALLVRKGGYAVGIFEGPRLVGSKVGSSYVQGKTKAGGWSQQRYARRRANQAEHAYAEAADVVAALLLPVAATLDAVVGGGDKTGVQAVLADPRLSLLLPLLTDPVLPTVDPRLRVLEAFPTQFRTVRIELNHLA